MGPGTLVGDPDSVAGVIKRLHVLNDAIVFWNEERSLKLMLRNDPIDVDTVACELAVLYDETDERMADMLDMTNDGYVDEAGTYVLDSWTWPAEAFDGDAARKVMQAINEAYLARVCPCGNYLIKDDAAMCLYCHLTATPAGRAARFCPICRDDGLDMHMVTQPCCGQHLHIGCLAMWKSKGDDQRCPLCRQ